ncbi:hypothetical protein Dimus_033627, partial [Dionaea muscipula]
EGCRQWWSEMGLRRGWRRRARGGGPIWLGGRLAWRWRAGRDSSSRLLYASLMVAESWAE